MKETIVFPDGASGAPSLDPNLVMAMNNGGMGGFGNGGWICEFRYYEAASGGGYHYGRKCGNYLYILDS